MEEKPRQADCSQGTMANSTRTVGARSKASNGEEMQCDLQQTDHKTGPMGYSLGSSKEQQAFIGSNSSLPLERYLKEGSSSTTEQHRERDDFDKGAPGMRRFLQHWQQKWGSITGGNSH